MYEIIIRKGLNIRSRPWHCRKKHHTGPSPYVDVRASSINWQHFNNTYLDGHVAEPWTSYQCIRCLQTHALSDSINIHTWQASPCCLASRLPGAANATARRAAKMEMTRILSKSQVWKFEYIWLIPRVANSSWWLRDDEDEAERIFPLIYTLTLRLRLRLERE
jgi:hypothetical protein